MVQISISWGGKLQSRLADVVEGLVVDAYHLNKEVKKKAKHVKKKKEKKKEKKRKE